MVEMAGCDSQQLGTGGGVGGDTQGNDSGDAAASPHVEAGERALAATPEPARPTLVSPHVGATQAPAPRARASQTIPPAVDLASQAYSTLRHLGFKHARARGLVDAVVQAGAPNALAPFVSAALRGS